MPNPVLSVRDRTAAPAAVDFILDKLAAYDTHLLDWIRIYPMTEEQHKPRIAGDFPPVTLSVCWPPRERYVGTGAPLPEHKYRIKVNVWQGGDYPALERDWGRVPARPLRRRRGVRQRYTTRGMCEWRHPDSLSATVHALARAIFLFLADTRQTDQHPSNSNASAWGHRWAVEWLHANGQRSAAESLAAQLVQWYLIQSKGI
ncbi:MAG: hypothetical protein OEM43_08705 [Gammaproteobacteria bacterium]|nr:hypothetical protein [Gammaproteobacteria bacterium]